MTSESWFPVATRKGTPFEILASRRIQPRSAAVPLTVSSPELNITEGSGYPNKPSDQFRHGLVAVQVAETQDHRFVGTRSRQRVKLVGQAQRGGVGIGLHRRCWRELSSLMPLIPRSKTSASSTLSTVSEENRLPSAIATG